MAKLKNHPLTYGLLIDGEIFRTIRKSSRYANTRLETDLWVTEGEYWDTVSYGMVEGRKKKVFALLRIEWAEKGAIKSSPVLEFDKKWLKGRLIPDAIEYLGKGNKTIDSLYKDWRLNQNGKNILKEANAKIALILRGYMTDRDENAYKRTIPLFSQTA